jgi:hypothetical protein
MVEKIKTILCSMFDCMSLAVGFVMCVSSVNCVRLFTVFCSVCTVFIVLFSLCVYFLTCLSVLPPSDNSVILTRSIPLCVITIGTEEFRLAQLHVFKLINPGCT